MQVGCDVSRTVGAQVFRQQCISKTTLKVLLFSQTVRSNGWLRCSLMTAICAGRGSLVKTRALWLTNREPAHLPAHTNKRVHTIMSQMRKNYWLTSLAGKVKGRLEAMSHKKIQRIIKEKPPGTGTGIIKYDKPLYLNSSRADAIPGSIFQSWTRLPASVCMASAHGCTTSSGSGVPSSRRAGCPMPPGLPFHVWCSQPWLAALFSLSPADDTSRFQNQGGRWMCTPLCFAPEQQAEKEHLHSGAHTHGLLCLPPADVMSVRVGALERLERSSVPQAWSWASVQNTAS